MSESVISPQTDDNSTANLLTPHTPFTPLTPHTPTVTPSTPVSPRDDEDSQGSTPRVGGVEFGEDEGRAKGDGYIDSEEAQSNFFKDRIQLNQVAKFIDPTKAFVFKDHFFRETKQSSISGKAIKCTIVEEVEQLSKEPKRGLFPPEFDEKTYHEKRMSAEFKSYIPSKFAPQPPALKRLEFYTRTETIMHFSELTRLDPANVLLINISNMLNPYPNLHQQLNRFVNCQFLALRNCGISTVRGIRLPNLRVCILSDNQIAHHMDLVPMLSACKLLQHLVVMNNPLERLPDWRDFIICSALTLISMNDCPVTIMEKQLAVEKKGTIVQKNQFGYMKWDWVINFLSDRMRIITWEPQKFTSLNLKQAKLREFHVGVFPNLKKLNLSYNEIISIAKSGLERCSKLTDFDFSYNLVNNVESLQLLKFCPHLISVRCNNNPLPSEYDLYIVYHTSNLKGSNRCPGLLVLNGQEISLDMRTRSIEKYGNSQQVEQMQWYYGLIKQYGHFQLRFIQNYVGRVRVMEITGQTGISIADLSPFKCLQYCDLSGNDLKKINGITRLKYLKYFDVSKNPKLAVDEVMLQLSKLTNLRHVLIGDPLSAIASPRVRRSTLTSSSTDSSPLSTRRERLTKLLSKNTKLFAMDGKEITLKERVEASPYTRMSHLEHMRYKFNLAIVYQVVPFHDRVFTDVAVKPASGLFDPTAIKILHLSNLGLKHSGFDFQPFVNLEKLDVSHNLISNITTMRLHYCRRLEILDMTNNKIKNSVNDVADLLNCFRNLEIVVLKGNPVAQQYSYRENLLKSLESMKSTTVKLKILDTEITPRDRQQVWEYHNLDTKDEELKRFVLTMKQRGYQDVENPMELTDINLNDSALNSVDLNPYQNIQVLILRGNRLVTLRGTGVMEMRQLRLLDVRNNKLNDIKEIIELIKNNLFIESVGLKLTTSGSTDMNFSKQPNYRYMVIKSVSSLRNMYSRFWEIDGTEITVDEIEANWPLPAEKMTEKEDREAMKIFRFRAVVWRKYLTICKLTKPLAEIFVVPAQIQCLDLSNQKLRTVTFKSFINLKKLSLKTNELDDDSLSKSGLLDIRIEALDIQDNNIKFVESITNFIDSCKSLRMFFCINNPCTPGSRRKAVRKHLLRQLSSTTNPKWRLVLDGSDVTIAERCAAVEKDLNTVQVETLRLELTLVEEGYVSGQENMIFLANKNLTLISKLQTFKRVAELDLSNNNIQELPEEFFRELDFLTKLDLRNNNLKNFDQSVKAIGQCGSLRTLYMEKAGTGFEDPVAYADSIFRSMRVLSLLDDQRNPYPLGADQRLAIQYLKLFRISPNDLQYLVFDTAVGKRQFWSITLALNALVIRYRENEPYVGPKTVTFGHDSLKGFDYRFILYHHIPSLEVIDDTAITDNEKNNTKVREEKLNKEVQEYRMLFADSPEQIAGLSDKLTIENIRKNVMAQKSYVMKTFGTQQKNTPSVMKPPPFNRFSKSFGSFTNLNYLKPSAPPIEQRQQLQPPKLNLTIDIERNNNADVQSPEVVLEMQDVDNAAANEYVVDDVEKENANGESNELAAVPLMETTHFSDLQESDIDFLYIENNFRTINLIQVYKQLIEQRRRNGLTNIITALDKLEIMVYFLQLFAIVYAFNIPWPDSFAIVAKWISLANISLEVLFTSIPSNEYYIKFTLMMVLPLLFLFLYLVNFNMRRWKLYFVKLLPLSLIILILVWIALYGVSFVISLATYPDSYKAYVAIVVISEICLLTCITTSLGKGKNLPKNVYWNLGLYCGIITVIFGTLLFNIILFRIKHADERFWYKFFTKFRQRFCLFLISIIYFPLFRDIIVTYECDKSFNRLRNYSNQDCPQNIKQAPPMYYVAGAFGILYGFGIPILFVVLILRDARFVYRDYGISHDYKDLSKKQKKLKEIRKERGKNDSLYKELNKYIQGKKKQLVKKYRDSVREHNSASSVLYASYKYYFRFYKIFQLSERLVLCCIASFLFTHTKVQAPVGFSIIFVYGAVTLICRPYQDPLTNIVDICTHATIVANLVFAYLLVRQNDIVKKSPWMKNVFKNKVSSGILYGINGLNILVLIIIFIIHPIRMRIKKKLWYKRRMKKAREMQDFIRENNDELNTTQVVREGKQTADTPVELQQQQQPQDASQNQLMVNPVPTSRQVSQLFSDDLKKYSEMSMYS